MKFLWFEILKGLPRYSTECWLQFLQPPDRTSLWKKNPVLNNSRKRSEGETTTTTTDSKQNSLELSVTRERDLHRATECRDVWKLFKSSTLIFLEEREGSSEYTRWTRPGCAWSQVMFYFKPKQDGKVRTKQDKLEGVCYKLTEKSDYLPGNSSQVSYEPAQVFRSYSVMVAPCWKCENGTSAPVFATCWHNSDNKTVIQKCHILIDILWRLFQKKKRKKKDGCG